MNDPPRMEVGEASGRRPRRSVPLWLAAYVPAIVGLTAAATVALSASMRDPAVLINRYRAEFERSRRANEFGAARICAERLTLLENASAESRLRLADALYNEGNLNRALGLVDTMTLPDGTGYVPARLWKARYLVSRPPITSEAVREAENQTRRALEAQPNLTEAAVMLAEIYIQTGRLKQAEPLLRQVVVELADLRVVLAAVHASQGNVKSARQEALTRSTISSTSANPGPTTSWRGPFRRCRDVSQGLGPGRGDPQGRTGPLRRDRVPQGDGRPFSQGVRRPGTWRRPPASPTG